MSERFIVHVDMDAFFAAIEQRDRPSLLGKPVVVGADPKGGKGRGVVSTCSYEARKFGIASAMPISQAYKKCPKAIFLPVDMDKYAEVSDQIHTLLYDFTPDIEPISIDEAFLDITGSCHLFGGALKTCKAIKQRLKKETSLTCSIGLAPTKMAAKIASDLKKPDGLVEVTQGSLLDFLWPLEVTKIWGLGKKTQKVLNDIGIKTIGDLAKHSKEELIDIFGKNGQYFWELSQGIDEREVETEEEEKSISNETTFATDTKDEQKIKATLLLLSEKVSARLRFAEFKGKTITLKIRLEDFSTFTRAHTLVESTNYVDVIYAQILSLFDKFKRKGKKVRLVGVKVSGLTLVGIRESIFEDKDDDKREKIHSAVEKIRRKLGTGAITRASSKLYERE
jgi:nucleotidyltransferase/DNA polymerase involved in DNA repair